VTSPVPIDVIYEAKTPLGTDLDKLVAALQIQVSRDFAPIWGPDCKLEIQPKVRPHVQPLIFLDDSDQADALGYHELTKAGLPLGKIFVKTTLQDKENPTVTASHELMEMLADPMLDRTAERAMLVTYAVEVADAVEEQTYKINSIETSNFVTQGWFGLPQSSDSGKLDFLGMCVRPWELLSGGYISVKLPGGDWQQLFGSVAAADRFRSARKWRGAARERGELRRSAR
jgi:hypothetical protein